MKPFVVALALWTVGLSGAAFAQTTWYSCQFSSAETGSLLLRVGVDEQTGLATAQWVNCGTLGCPPTNSGTVQSSGDHLLVDFGDYYNLTFPRSGGLAGFMAFVIEDVPEGYCTRA